MRKRPNEDCFLCDGVMAVLGGLVGVLLIGIAADLLTKGAISGAIGIDRAPVGTETEADSDE